MKFSHLKRTLHSLSRHATRKLFREFGSMSRPLTVVFPDLRELVNNMALVRKDVRLRNPRPASLPTNVTISLSNQCNRRCPICAIGNLSKNSSLKRVCNNLSLDQLKCFSQVFRVAESLSFGGFVGESILNPEFVPIVECLKANSSASLAVSTNGSAMSSVIRDTMIDCCFDSITFSIHASTPETYATLQGGDLSQVMANLRGLRDRKRQMRALFPRITVAYALNKINLEETLGMVDILKEYDIHRLYLYHYRDYGVNQWSLDDDVDYANDWINKIYGHARRLKLENRLPPKPPYFEQGDRNTKSDASDFVCESPWTTLSMRSSYSHKNSLYVGCCNVLNLFRLDYEEHLSKYERLEFLRIWHHPLLVHLRETVNSCGDKRKNPLCSYCRSPLRSYLKGVDNMENYRLKTRHIAEFYDQFRRRYREPIEPVHGLTVLWREDDELTALARVSE